MKECIKCKNDLYCADLLGYEKDSNKWSAFVECNCNAIYNIIYTDRQAGELEDLYYLVDRAPANMENITKEGEFYLSVVPLYVMAALMEDRLAYGHDPIREKKKKKELLNEFMAFERIQYVK